MLIYFFKKEIPKEFPFIHDKVSNDCMVVTVILENENGDKKEIPEEDREKTAKEFFKQNKEWYKNYIIY